MEHHKRQKENEKVSGSYKRKFEAKFGLANGIICL